MVEKHFIIIFHLLVLEADGSNVDVRKHIETTKTGIDPDKHLMGECCSGIKKLFLTI